MANISDFVGEITSASTDSTKVADIITFSEATWGLNMNLKTGNTTLRPVQQMMLKCYYNLELDDKEKNIIVRDHLNEVERFRFTEKEYLHFLYNEGRTNLKAVDSKLRNELVLVAGRRGGKSKLGAIVSAYEAYKLLKKEHPQKYYKMSDNSEIYLSTVATSTEQAELLFNDIASYIDNSPFFARYKNNPTMQYMKLRTPYDLGLGADRTNWGSLIVKAAPCSGRGLRGMSNIVIIMDEQAHFVDNSANKSDAAIYDAVTPSTLSFGRDAKILNLSSPLNKQGKLWDLFNASKESEKILMFQIPSWELWDGIDSSMLRESHRRNPDVFWCEIGAQFSDTVKSWMPHDPLVECIVPELSKKMRGKPRTPYFMGIDIGLKNDMTAISISHIEYIKEPIFNVNNQVIDEITIPKYELDAIEVMQAGVGEYEGAEFLDFEEIAENIEKLCKEFHVHKGLFDQYNGVPLKQRLDKRGLTQFEMVYFDRRLNSELYNNWLLAVIDGRVRLYDEPPVTGSDKKHGPFISEVMQLQSQFVSKYITIVQAPDMEGCHDDRSDSFARSLWLASEYLTKTKGAGEYISAQQAQQQTEAHTYNHYKMMKNRSRAYGGYSTQREVRPRNSQYSVFFNKRGKR
jgi:hypothetical protein